MLEVYRKIYQNKIVKETTYYFNINNRGFKKYYETIYEMVSDIDHYFSKYTVIIEGELKNAEKIKNDVVRCTPSLFNSIKEKRRLGVLAKFILYVIATTNNSSIYKMIREVKYYNNGNEISLSPNAFTKSAYKLVPVFERVYKQ